MPYDINWQSPNYILFIAQYDPFSPTDLNAMNDDLADILNSSEDYLYLIFDHTHLQHHPLDMALLRRLCEHLAAFKCTMVITDHTPFWHFFQESVSRISGARLLRVESFEEALETIDTY